jgi:prepilin-type N-terminal cleavage/methylation domain-containing protein
MFITNKNNGFSLIELAMVLFILSLMMSSFLTPLATSLEQRDREKTNELLEEVRESLIGYALVNGHLPCPDCSDNTTNNCGIVETALGATKINDGIEDGVDTGVPAASNDRSNAGFLDCGTTVGNLPWVTLDVAENDAWGNHFIYRVTDDFADNTDGTADCTNPAVGISFCLDSAKDDADISIFDDSTLANAITNNVPAVVFSIGNNSDVLLANLSADETENQNGNASFVSRDYISTTGAEFDDMLMWISPPILMYQMVRAERLP